MTDETPCEVCGETGRHHESCPDLGEARDRHRHLDGMAPPYPINTDGDEASAPWTPEEEQTDLVDTRPTKLLNDWEARHWSGNLSPPQVGVVVTVWQIVRDYCDEEDEARQRMPNMMSFLDLAMPISASVFGTGRKQLVEMLKDKPKTRESLEAVIAPVDTKGEVNSGGGGKRGF